TLFGRHADAAESAVDVERAGTVPEHGLVAARVGDPLAFNGDIAHRGSRGDAHAGPAGEAHFDLSHVAADGARARVELACSLHVAGDDAKPNRPAEVVDAAITRLILPSK